MCSGKTPSPSDSCLKRLPPLLFFLPQVHGSHPSTQQSICPSIHPSIHPCPINPCIRASVCLYPLIGRLLARQQYHFDSHLSGENRFLCLAPHPVAHSGSAHDMQMYLLIFWPLTMLFQFLCVASGPCNWLCGTCFLHMSHTCCCPPFRIVPALVLTLAASSGGTGVPAFIAPLAEPSVAVGDAGGFVWQVAHTHCLNLNLASNQPGGRGVMRHTLHGGYRCARQYHFPFASRWLGETGFSGCASHWAHFGNWQAMHL